MAQNIKNKEEILLSTDQVRAERIREKDKSLFFFNERKQIKYGHSSEDTIEFSVMDFDNNLLYWEDKGLQDYKLIQGQAAVESLVLMPGDDLRRNGFQRGLFRVGYNFFNNALGSFPCNKVFIQEISPTRKEIRILPVKIGDVAGDAVFATQFADFSDTLILGKDFADLTLALLTNFPGFGTFNEELHELELIIADLETVINNFEEQIRETAFGGVQDAAERNRLRILQNVEKISLKELKKRQEIFLHDISDNERFFRKLYGQLINEFQSVHDNNINTISIPTVLTKSNRDEILRAMAKEAVGNVLSRENDSAFQNAEFVLHFEERLVEIANPSDEVINDSFRFLRYVINFGQNKNYLIVNWERDDIEFPDAPFSIVLKLLDPLPDEFEVNDSLWISRELTPPVFEKVFLQGLEDEEITGTFLRPPNFDIDVDKLGYRSTPLESHDDLVSTHATTSQQLVDHFFSGSLEGADINIDFTDFNNFVHFGSATERLNNFKLKLITIESQSSQITSLLQTTGSASRSLNVLGDIARLELKKTNAIGAFDTYENFLFNTSGSDYSASVPASESVSFNQIGEWPKENRIAPFVLLSVTASEAVTWFDALTGIADLFDVANADRLVNNTPVHIALDDDNSDYMLFLNMIGQYFDVFYSYITALGKLHNRDENLFEGLSKDLTFNVVKSFGFDLENGHDFKPLWESAFGFDVSGSLLQTGDLVTGWINTSSFDSASFETFATSSINAINVDSAINTATSGAFQSNTFVKLPQNKEFEVLMDISGTLDTGTFEITNVSASVFNQALVTGSNSFTFSASENWTSGFRVEIRATGSSDFTLKKFTIRPVEGLVQSLPTTDISKEIWRRILNNLPYILKTKGTARSLKALLACYGIPQSILAIREYGGPDPRQASRLQDRSSFIFEDFVHAINFDAAQDVTAPWEDFGTNTEKPHTVELTFKTSDYGASTIATQSLINVTGSIDGWGVSLRTTGSLFGRTQGIVVFEISSSEISSSVFDFYNNDFYTVILTHTDFTHSLIVKRADSSRITYQSSASVTSTSSGTHWELDSTIQIGSSSEFGSAFSGSIKEFRLFQPNLSQSVTDAHVRWPKSYNSNNQTSSFDDLVLRYSFSEPRNHADNINVQDVKMDQTSFTIGTASGFARGVNYTPTTQEYAVHATQLGGNRFISNKVRIEDASLIFGNLNVSQRMEVSSFDFAPLDSNRLGIYFSPIDAINRDIMATFGDTDLSGFLGLPSDVFTGSYTGLKEINDFYFQKFTTLLDYNKFIKVLKRYDSSFFQQIKNLLPARADATVGILIEPHILERNKERTLRPIEAPKRLEQSGSTIVIWNLSHSAAMTESVFSVAVGSASFDISSTVPTHSMVISASSGETASYTVGFAWQQQGLIDMIFPREELTSSFADTKRDQSASDRIKYRGVLNTKETSIDGKEPIETFLTNPNILISVDEGPSKLKVE